MATKGFRPPRLPVICACSKSVRVIQGTICVSTLHYIDGSVVVLVIGYGSDVGWGYEGVPTIGWLYGNVKSMLYNPRCPVGGNL